MQPPAKPHNHGHSPRQRAKTLSQSGSRDTQMVARRNLLLRRRRHQCFLTQLTPHTQVILSVCCDPLPIAAQRIALPTKFRCYHFSLADQPVASRCEADRSRRPGPALHIDHRGRRQRRAADARDEVPSYHADPCSTVPRPGPASSRRSDETSARPDRRFSFAGCRSARSSKSVFATTPPENHLKYRS